MEETESVKEWFVTHDGKQFGPVSINDLKYEAERGGLNPRLDMVWKSGMNDWIPAGDVGGLFKLNEEAKAAEQAKEIASIAGTAYTPEISQAEKKLIKGEWTGVGRGTYLFVCCVLPFLWMVALGFGMKFLEKKVDPLPLGIGFLVLCLVPIYLIISATLKRFQNLGMSRGWVFGLLAPFLNLWVWYRLFACPPGYAYHKKLDPLGWLLAVLHWGSVLVVIAASGFAAYALTQTAEDDPTRIAIEDYIEKIEASAKAREKR